MLTMLLAGDVHPNPGPSSGSHNNKNVPLISFFYYSIIQNFNTDNYVIVDSECELLTDPLCGETARVSTKGIKNKLPFPLTA